MSVYVAMHCQSLVNVYYLWCVYVSMRVCVYVCVCMCVSVHDNLNTHDVSHAPYLYLVVVTTRLFYILQIHSSLFTITGDEH